MNTKIITIAQQKGGAGKTTIAAHLAVAFAKAGKKVAALDLDPQASLSTWGRIRNEKLGENNNVYVAAVTKYNIEKEIQKLRGTADIVIIDSPPHIESAARNAIRSADLVILPVQPSPTDLWATKATMEICEQENITGKILLNRVAANSRLGTSIRTVFEKSAPKFIMKTQLGNRVDYAGSILTGLTSIETSPSSNAAKEMQAVLKEIATILGDKLTNVKKTATTTKAIKTVAKKAAPTKAIAKKTTKPIAKKIVAKKAAPKKVAVKKVATKKVATKKPALVTAAPKKIVTKKAVAKKAAPKKVAAKKIATKKVTTKKAAPKKVAVKKVAIKKPVTKITTKKAKGQISSNVTKLPVKKKPAAKKTTIKRTKKPSAA